jgi:hypothetical protein
VTATLTRDDRHIYRLDGAELMSVTAAIREAGLSSAEWSNPDAMLRGSHVHQACEFFDQGDLDDDTLDPALRPYLDAYRWFVHDAQPTWSHIEAQRASLTHRYAGTVDRAGTLINQKHPVVLDIKSGGPEPWHAIQLAAYRRLLADELGPLIQRLALYLRADGTYRLETLPLADQKDFDVFLAALTVAGWKRSHA